jgi:hypothetical protein
MRRLSCARLACGIGDFALPVTLAYLVLERWHGTATQVGLVLGAHVAGSLLYLLIGRVRLPARRVMVVANLSTTGIQAAVVALYAMHALAVPVLAGLMLWRGFASAFFTPAAHAVGGRRALVPALAVVLGPLIGYRLIAGPGIVAALGVDVVMYLLAAALVLRVPDTPMPVRPPLAMGWREVARRRWLRRTLATVVAVNLFAAGPLLTLAPARAGVFGYSLILTAIGGGAVVGSVFSGYLRKGAVVWLSAAAVGPLVLAFGAGLPLAFLAFAVVGAVQPVHDMLLARALRDRLPRAALGPVSAAEEVASLAVLPVGQVLGGLAIDRFGVTSMAWVIVAALASAALSPILHTRRDRADIRSGSPASSASR